MIPRIMLASIDMDSVMNNGMSIPERLGLGLETMLIGLGTVFGVLIIIMAILYFFQFIFYTLPNRRKNKEESEANESTIVDETTADSEENAAESENEGEIIAAISAAVSVYLDQPTSSFRVVSFKRIQNQNKHR